MIRVESEVNKIRKHDETCSSSKADGILWTPVWLNYSMHTNTIEPLGSLPGVAGVDLDRAYQRCDDSSTDTAWWDEITWPLLLQYLSSRPYVLEAWMKSARAEEDKQLHAQSNTTSACSSAIMNPISPEKLVVRIGVSFYPTCLQVLPSFFLISPQPYRLVLASTPHLLPIRTPIYGVHLVIVTWKVFGQLTRARVPYLERIVARACHEQPAVG